MLTKLLNGIIKKKKKSKKLDCHEYESKMHAATLHEEKLI